MNDAVTISPVTEADLADLLVLMRAYCDFYDSHPTDEGLTALSHALLADPEREGVQFLARDSDGHAAAFATVFWSWETNAGGRIGVMNDLFVDPDHRGLGIADALIAACRQAAAEHGAVELSWQTGLENGRASAAGRRPPDR